MKKPEQISIVLNSDEFDVHVKAAFYDADLANRYASIVGGWAETVSISDANETPLLSSRLVIAASSSKRIQRDKSNTSASIHSENDLDDGLERGPRAEYSDNAGVQFVMIERSLELNEDPEFAKKKMRKSVRDYLTQAMMLREDGYDPLRIQTLLHKHFSENH